VAGKPQTAQMSQKILTSFFGVPVPAQAVNFSQLRGFPLRDRPLERIEQLTSLPLKSAVFRVTSVIDFR
jgi:hypothetical protein